MWVVGGVTVGVFFVRFWVFDFKESPKFLLSKGAPSRQICHSSAFKLMIDPLLHLGAQGGTPKRSGS